MPERTQPRTAGTAPPGGQLHAFTRSSRSGGDWRRRKRRSTAASSLPCSASGAQSEQMTALTYSLSGLRADADMMLWRICYSLECLQQMQAELMRTAPGRVPGNAAFLPRHDPPLAVQDRPAVTRREHHQVRRLSLRLGAALHQDARLVPARVRGAPAHRQRVRRRHRRLSPRAHEHAVFLRHRRPGIRAGLRERSSRRHRGPENAPARNRERHLHPAGHARVHRHPVRY